MNFIYLLDENEIGTNPHPGGYFAAFQGPGDPWFLYLIPVFDDGNGYMIDEFQDPIQTSIRSDNAGFINPIMDGSAEFAQGGWMGEIDLGGYMLSDGGESGSGGGDLGLPVYSLTIDAIGAHDAGLYAIDQDEQGNILLVAVEEDTETAETDDYIVVDTVDPITITGLDEATKAALLEGSWDGAGTGSTLMGVAFYVGVPGGGGSITELMIDDFGTPGDTYDDELVIARAADDTGDYSAADLILRMSLDGGMNYDDYHIAMDVFAISDYVGMEDTSISGGTYSISSQINDIMNAEGYDQTNPDHSASLVLVDDFNAVDGNYIDLMQLPLNQAAPEDPNESEAVTHLRFDDPENPTKLLLDVASDDSTIDPTTADLMVEYTLDNWGTVERALIQGNAFSVEAGATITGNVFEREAPDVTNILLGVGFDENNSDHHFGIVLVDDWEAQIPLYVAEFLVPSEGDGTDTGTGGGDGNTQPEYTVLAFNDKGNNDPSDDTFMIVRGENDDEDYSGADLMAWIRPEGTDPYLVEIVQDPFSHGDEIAAGILEGYISSAFGGTVPDFVELVLVDDSSAAAPYVLAELMGINEGGDTSSPAGAEYDVYDLDVDEFGLTEAGTYALLFEGPNEIGKFNLLLQEVAFDNLTTTYSPVGNPVYAAIGTSSIYPVGPAGDPDGFYQIHNLAAGQFGATHAGFYVIWPGADGIQMFEVENTGTAESPTWVDAGPATPPMPVGSVFIGDPVDDGDGDGDGGSGPTTDGLGIDSPFELVEVQGERYGDIITFGIRVKDNDDGTIESIDLASASFSIDWNEGEYEYWGGFENVNATPTNDSAANVSLGLTLNSAGEDDTRINLETFGFGDTAPITYSEGDLVATFMLERTDQSANVTNDIYLTKSNFSEADDASTTDVDESIVDILTKPQTFTFDYDLDTININMVTASGVEAPDATLYVSSDTVTDGLSVVAVEQMGRLVKYQLVLNVSVPMTMDALATIDTNQSVDIYGAHIFTDSLMDITILEDGAGAASVSAAVINATDGTGTEVGVNDAANGYTGTEFFDQVDAAMSLLEDSGDTSLLENIGVTDHLHIDVEGLADLTNEGTDGRYVLAEFVAYTNGSISFSDDWNVDDGITINQIEVIDADATTQTFEVSDGSDVVLLGESVYLNPGLNIDAISATDALGALKIATDDTGYSQSQIIAADFDADGVVEAMDAYNILHYAVFGEGSENEVPTWVYIDDIESGTASADDVTYDDNIDLFIGDLTNIDATGVLRGDVSENCTEIPDGYDTLDYYLGAFTAAMGDLGTDLETAPTYVA